LEVFLFSLLVIGMYVVLTLQIQGVSGVRHMSVSDTDKTPVYVVIFSYFIFPNYHWCRNINVVFGVCVYMNDS
jgi:hypothetical protein